MILIPTLEFFYNCYVEFWKKIINNTYIVYFILKSLKKLTHDVSSRK